jgi:hypothetical protein
MAEFGMHQPGYNSNSQGYTSQAGYVQPEYPGYPPIPSTAAPTYGQQPQYTYQPPPPPYGNVEWYSGNADPSTVAFEPTGNMGNMSFNPSSASFEDEPPLLEGGTALVHPLAVACCNLGELCAELGIDVSAILLKTRAIVFYRMQSRHLEDLDMGGALIFVCLLGGLHLLVCANVLCCTLCIPVHADPRPGRSDGEVAHGCHPGVERAAKRAPVVAVEPACCRVLTSRHESPGLVPHVLHGGLQHDTPAGVQLRRPAVAKVRVPVLRSIQVLIWSPTT